MDSTGLSPQHRDRFERWLTDRFRSIFGGRRWITAFEVDQGAVRVAAGLREQHGVEVLAVGARTGTGPVDPAVSPDSGEFSSPAGSSGEAGGAGARSSIR